MFIHNIYCACNIEFQCKNKFKWHPHSNLPLTINLNTLLILAFQTILTEWLSWVGRNRLRGCLHPALPRTCHLQDLEGYQRIRNTSIRYRDVRKPAASYSEEVLPSLKKLRFHGDKSTHKLGKDSSGEFVTWEMLRLINSSAGKLNVTDVRIDLENCLNPGVSEINLGNMNRWHLNVGHNY